MLSEKLAAAHVHKNKSNAYTVEGRQPLRDEIAFDVEVFLMLGGKIQQVGYGVASYNDAPKSLYEINEMTYRDRLRKEATAASSVTA